MTGSPRWSPDGRSLAFDSRVRGHAEIYTADLVDGSVKRVTGDAATAANDVVPSWSRDGRSIYFSSDRTGSWQVWKHSLATGADVQVTSNGGFDGVQSEDGRYLFYISDMNRTEVRRRASNNPQDDVPVALLEPGMWHSWTLAGKSLLYLRASASGQADVVRYTWRSGKSAVLDSVSQAANDSISFSADQHSLLYARRLNTGSSLVLVEGWR